MNVLTRYIAKEVGKTTLVVLSCLCGLYLVFAFIQEAKEIGQGQYSMLRAAWYVFMSLPANLYLALPMAGLLGVMLSLGQLAGHHEVVVMRCAGASYVSISRGVLIVALIMWPVTFVLGAFVSPYLSHQAMISKTLAQQSNRAVLMTSESIWLRERGDYIYIDNRQPDGQLQGVVRYHMSENELTAVTWAKRARFEDNLWRLHDVEQIKLESDQVVREVKPVLEWTHFIEPKLIGVVIAEPEELTLPSLKAYIDYRKQNALDADYYQLTFWRTIFQPFSTLILMVLGVPFVCGFLRASNVSLRLISGVLLSFTMYLFDQFFGPLSLLIFMPPIMGAMLPSVLFFILTFILFRAFK